MSSGKIVTIAGIDFQVQETLPTNGIVVNSTIIVYDGKGISRREEIISRSPPALSGFHRRPQHIPNNRVLIRQLIQMLETMNMLSEELSETTLSQLPTFILDNLPSSAEQKGCLICLNDFEIGNKVRTLPCCKI